jgi:hypothetical protein
MAPLESFYTGIVTRVHRDGWVEIIMPILAPIINNLIERCFDNGPAMREGLRRLNFAQQIAINNAARQICNECGIRILQRSRAVASISAALQAEIKEALTRDASDEAWQEFYNDVVRYS